MTDLKNSICSELKIPSDGVFLKSMPSGASSKKYHTVSGIAQERPSETFIVMQAPVATLSDFLNITNFLLKHNIHTPRIIHYSSAFAFVIMENCGDLTLETLLKKTSADETDVHYKAAIDLLVAMQISSPGVSDIASKRFFDKEKFNFEYEFHVCDKLIKNYFRYSLSVSEKGILDVLFETITRELSDQPFVFVHRDFQSSNLLVKDAELVVIDYQDARMGSALYDLVSLIEDVYIEVPARIKSRLITYYIESAGRFHIPLPQMEYFSRIYDLITIQRKLHDAGAFAFCFENFANVKYLAYINKAFQHALDVMSRFTIFKGPYELLTMISHAHRTEN